MSLLAWANAPFLTEHGEHATHQGQTFVLEQGRFATNPQHSVSSGVRRSPDLYDGQPVVMLMQRNGILNQNYLTLSVGQAEALAALLLQSVAVCRELECAVQAQEGGLGGKDEAAAARYRALMAAKYVAKVATQGSAA